VAAGIPSIWLLLYRSLRSGNYQVPKLQRLLVGGAAMPQSSIEDYARELGITVMHAWGMTETSPMGTMSRLMPHQQSWPEEERFAQLAKQGIAAAWIEMKIVDDDGNELPRDGESFGELLVRGPWVAGSYYRLDEEANAASFTSDGWFRTGDIATIDEHGSMHIVDRKKDLIKTRGEWVSSVAMENTMVRHDDIVEAAVVGRPDELRGEAVVLFVVCAPEARDQLSAKDLCTYLEQSFEDWQIPRQKDVHFIDALPKTSVGKIDKKALRAQLVTTS
jgi:fatty-acyl-CoA synthase